MNAKELKERDELEALIVAEMSNAYTIAEKFWGAAVGSTAVELVYDGLQNADDVGVDEEEFTADLQRVIGHAKVVYRTETPSPEQVFGLFERIFDTDDEDED